MVPGYMQLNISVRNRKKTSKEGQPQVVQPEKAIWVFRMPILGGCVLCMAVVRKVFNILIG
jgi:hypothetical protein